MDLGNRVNQMDEKISDLKDENLEINQKKRKTGRTRRNGSCGIGLCWDVGVAVWKGDHGMRKGQWPTESLSG